MTRQVRNICVVGSGVVGFATGKGYASKGFDVTFVDVSEDRINLIRNEGYKAYTVDEINNLTSYEPDVTILTLPTPTIDGAIKLDYIKAACVDLGKRLKNYKNYHLVVSRSTLPPGTNREIIVSILEEVSGKKVGVDFGLCMNPEYLREVSAAADFANPWIIVIGEYDQRSGDMLYDVYKDFNCPIHRVTIEEAEMQKYIHNLYNANKISFYNEFRSVCKELDLNPENIFPLVAKSCEGMWNTNYGIKDFGPFMGMCLPKDTQAFYAWAKEKNISMPLLRATIAVNDSLLMAINKPEYMSVEAKNKQSNLKALMSSLKIALISVGMFKS